LAGATVHPGTNAPALSYRDGPRQIFETRERVLALSKAAGLGVTAFFGIMAGAQSSLAETPGRMTLRRRRL